jgi:hypothetical protein
MSRSQEDQGYRKVLTLLSTQNVEEAIRLTIAKGSKAYGFWAYVRNKFFHDDKNRHPQYLSRLRDLQYRHFSPQEPEWQLFEQLYDSPLHVQYRVEACRKPYLANHPELDQALKMIKSLPESFYNYTLPPEYAEDAIERARDARELKHARAITISDLQMILSKSRDWRQYQHPWELVSCALFLCGRRVGEVINTLVWEYHGPYTARVRGISKQTDTDEAVIPLLCTYEDFDGLMTKIRETQFPTTSTTHRLKPAFVRVFGEWFGHAHRRNIYGEAAFRMRNDSGFHPTMSRVMWIDMALAHQTNVIHSAGNLVYQSLLFNDE